MVTSKIQKSELESGDIPTLCMVCGEKDGETRIPFLARLVPFPLTMFGIVGKFLAPRKFPMTVITCKGCKSGFIYEQTMTNIWLSLRLLAVAALAYVLLADSEGAPENLLIPMLIVIITVGLESMYFWTVGKKNAIRVSNMDEQSVSLDLPNEKWGVAYTAHRREKEGRKKSGRSVGSMLPPPG
jgi:hypothetical protein